MLCGVLGRVASDHPRVSPLHPPPSGNPHRVLGVALTCPSVEVPNRIDNQRRARLQGARLISRPPCHVCANAEQANPTREQRRRERLVNLGDDTTASSRSKHASRSPPKESGEFGQLRRRRVSHRHPDVCPTVSARTLRAAIKTGSIAEQAVRPPPFPPNIKLRVRRPDCDEKRQSDDLWFRLAVTLRPPPNRATANVVTSLRAVTVPFRKKRQRFMYLFYTQKTETNK